jgi:DNA-binding CsgD family transcriptional regulator
MALIPPSLQPPAAPGDGDGRALDEQVQIVGRTAFGGLLLVDDSRRYVRVNDCATKILGAPLEVILSSRIDDFTAPAHLSELELFWAALERDRELAGRAVVRRYDGSAGTCEYRAQWGVVRDRHLFALREIVAPSMPALASGGEAAGPLTARELEVLQLAAEGNSTESIAAELVLSPGTVKTHFHHIYGKLGAQDRVSAVATALRVGLIT